MRTFLFELHACASSLRIPLRTIKNVPYVQRILIGLNEPPVKQAEEHAVTSERKGETTHLLSFVPSFFFHADKQPGRRSKDKWGCLRYC